MSATVPAFQTETVPAFQAVTVPAFKTGTVHAIQAVPVLAIQVNTAPAIEAESEGLLRADLALRSLSLAGALSTLTRGVQSSTVWLRLRSSNITAGVGLYVLRDGMRMNLFMDWSLTRTEP